MSEEPKLSAVVAALEKIWTAAQAKHPDLPGVAVVIDPSPRRGVCPASGNRRGGVYEVRIAGEELRRPAREVLGVLLHAGAHALGEAREIRTTSRGGRYHSKKFAVLAEELGLEVAELPGFGHVETTVPDSTARSYSRQVAALERVLEQHRSQLEALAHALEDVKPKSNNLLPATCACGRRLRIARATLDAGPVVCGLCDSEFVAEG